MKHFFYCLFLLSTVFCFGQSTIFSGQLNNSEIETIVKNYNWDKNKTIIINFRHESQDCHYDNNQNLESGKKWWSNFYKDFNYPNVQNHFVYVDKFAAQQLIDQKTYFGDTDKFIHKKFFSRLPYCYGVVVINPSGKYKGKGSEYQKDEVFNFILEAASE